MTYFTKEIYLYIFDASMTITKDHQQNFLSNDKNKSRFICQLSKKMREQGLTVHQTPDDAETQIINTAILLSAFTSYVAVVGEDANLIVLLTALTPEDRNIFFLSKVKVKLGIRCIPPWKYRLAL